MSAIPTLCSLLALIVLCNAIPDLSHGSSCSEEGRFADPTDCRSYLLCLQNASLALQVTRMSCPPGTAFSTAEMQCLSHDKVAGCDVSERRGRETARLPQFDAQCASTASGQKCGDCKTSITCYNNEAYEGMYCNADHTCQNIATPAIGGVCYPTSLDTETVSADTCKCLNPGPEFKIDPRNGNGFVLCSVQNEDVKVFKCTSPMTFNEGTKSCENANNSPPPCKEAGKFPVDTTCEQYYVCVQVKGDMVQTVFDCNIAGGEFFDEINQVCNLKSGWSTAAFVCAAEGVYADPEDCHNRYYCLNDGSGSFLSYKTTCPEGTMFSVGGATGTGDCVSAATATCTEPAVRTCTV